MGVAARIDSSGLALEEVARRAGIATERLREIYGGAEGSLSELRHVAQALGVTTLDLIESSPAEGEARLLFRRTVSDIPRKSARRAPVDDFAIRISSALELLEPDVPSNWLRLASEVDTRAPGAAERLATYFRRWFVGDNHLIPLTGLPSICVERLGMLLYVISNPVFEGASGVVRDQVFVFVSRRSFRARMLFTLAHELGHLIAHHHGGDFGVVDFPEDVAQPRARRRADEALADSFASCLLMPSEGLAVALRTIRKVLGVRRESDVSDVQLLYLARFFGVSFQVAAKRCEDLDLIPIGGGISLYEHIRANHKNPEQYADQLGVPPREAVEFPSVQSRLLRDAIRRVRKGDVSVGRAAAILRMGIGDLQAAHAATR